MSELLEKTAPAAEQEAVEADFVPAPKRDKPRLTHRLWAKTGAFILCVLMICTCFLSILAAACMIHEEVYTTPKRAYWESALRNIAESDGHTVAHLILNQHATEGADNYLIYRNVAEAELRFDTEPEPRWTYQKGDAVPSHEFVYECDFQTWTDERGNECLGFYVEAWEVNARDFAEGTVTIRLDESLMEQDDYYFAKTLIDVMYYFRYSVYIIILTSAILAIACFVFLLCAAGRHADQEGVRPGWDTRIPFDLLTAGVAIGCLCCGALMSEAAYSDYVTMIAV